MGRHRIHADDAAKARAYRVRVAQEREAVKEKLDLLRTDPEEGARWLVEELGLDLAGELAAAIETRIDEEENGVGND
jgi:hypothetical protein